LPVILGVEVVLLGALAALAWRQRAIPGPGPGTSATTLWTALPGVALAVMMGLFLIAFVSASDLNPQGGWDAFSIWNLRARFLLHTETWRYAVTPYPVGAHMEYPLLLSSVIARGWTYTGSPSSAVPIVTAGVFAVALVMLLVSALSLERGAGIGLLAGVLLLANPSLTNQAPSQYADIPLSFFFLAALVLVVRGGKSARPVRDLSLAGALAGFAALTKNEGALLLVALVAAIFVGAWRAAGWRSAVRQSGIFVLGALPALLLLLWFKMIAPPDPLTGQMTANLGQKIGNAGRWIQVAGGFLKQIWELYVFPAPALALLAVTAGLLRLRPRPERSLGPWIAVLIALAGYFAIFMVTGNDLDWLFATAIDRLFLHIWPAFLLAVFLWLRRPEDFAIVIGAPKAKKAR
jgi:hypothetical protein